MGKKRQWVHPFCVFPGEPTHLLSVMCSVWRILHWWRGLKMKLGVILICWVLANVLMGFKRCYAINGLSIFFPVFVMFIKLDCRLGFYVQETATFHIAFSSNY